MTTGKKISEATSETETVTPLHMAKYNGIMFSLFCRGCKSKNGDSAHQRPRTFFHLQMNGYAFVFCIKLPGVQTNANIAFFKCFKSANDYQINDNDF